MDVHALARPPHLTAIGGVDAGDAFDQAGFARAVVSSERRHLPGGDLEIDVGQRLDRAEPLADALEAQERLDLLDLVRSPGSRDDVARRVPPVLPTARNRAADIGGPVGAGRRG